ncbi:MAG: T9SS type A sorting domain-containing protein [Bacteroidales bacterium]|nr:T9SS type A sorting domain-containing protein [Bacteroidales bacterium]
MKKQSLLKTLFLCVSLAFVTSLTAQVNITGVTDSTAVLDENFSATVLYTVSGGGAPTWTLPLCPAGMTINSSGVISYHPTVQNDGGRVVVRASNANGIYEYHFNVYISNAVSCNTDIISYHTLNEAGGTSFADFASGHDATSATSLSSGTGAVDGAVNMAPASVNTEFISVPDNDQYEWACNQSWTFSAWIDARGKIVPGTQEDQILWMRVNSDATSRIIIGLDGQGFDNVMKPKFRFRDSGSDSNVTFIPDVELIKDSLQHIAFAYVANGSGLVNLRWYLNGVRISNPQIYVAPAANFYMDAPATIGCMDFPSVIQHNPFNGVMDEVIIYNRALTDAEVLQMYTDGLAGEAHCKPGNHAPEFVNYFPAAIDQGGTYDVTLTTYDIEGDGVSIGMVSIPDWMQYNSSTKRLTNKSGRPNNDDVGEGEVIVTANDGTILVTRAFPIEVIDVNDDPYFTSSQGNVTINEDTKFKYHFTYDEIDPGDVVTITAPTKPAWLTLNTVSDSLIGTCTNAHFTVGTSPSESFPVILRIEDESGAYDEQSFTITVNNVNDAPVISGQNTISTDENESITLTPSVAFSAGHINDPDDIFPTDFSLTVNAGTNYTVSGSNTVVPALNWSGILNVPITFSDGQASVSYTLYINVNFVNEIPVVESDPSNIADDYELYEYTMEVSDGDPGDVLTMNDSILPIWLTFNEVSGYLSGTPGWDDIGDTIAILTVTDGHVTVVHQIPINVLNTNSVPEITSTPATEWYIGDVYQYTMTATDVDEDDELTFTAITKPDFLTFTAYETEALIHGVPTEADEGTHDILLQVTDGSGLDQQQYSLVITYDALSENKISSVLVYPIPATTELTIEYKDVLNDAVFQIMNMNGQTITEEPLEYNNGKISIDISDLNQGMYLYRVIEGNEIATGKFLVK